jgi:hypothetical protein
VGSNIIRHHKVRPDNHFKYKVFHSNWCWVCSWNFSYLKVGALYFRNLCCVTFSSFPGVDFLFIEVVEHHFLQLFDQKIYLYGPPSSIKSWAQKPWERSSTIWPQKGGKKLAVKNCAKLPIIKKSTPGLSYVTRPLGVIHSVVKIGMYATSMGQGYKKTHSNGFQLVHCFKGLLLIILKRFSTHKFNICFKGNDEKYSMYLSAFYSNRLRMGKCITLKCTRELYKLLNAFSFQMPNSLAPFVK